MADKMAQEQRFSLMIEGDNLPVESLEQELGLKPTRVVRKGELLNRLPEIYAAADEWVCSVALTAPEGVDTGLNQLLAALIDHKPALDELISRYSVTLRLFVQSDYAHIAYSLMPETMQRLVRIGLPLTISSLSWGEFDI